MTNEKPLVDFNLLKRPKLLMARYENEIKSATAIPLLENEISEKDYRIAQKSSKQLKATDMHSSYPESIGFIKRIRTHELLNQARLAVPPHVDNFVREERIPEAVDQRNFLDVLLPQYRPLHPHRMERKTFSATNPDSCKIVIQVLRGFNFPSRLKPKTNAKSKVKSEDDESDPTVRHLIIHYFLDDSPLCRGMLSEN